MAARPDITAFASHEERVRAFLASASPARRRRVERRHAVLSDYDEKRIAQEECAWDPDLLDRLVVLEGPIHRTPVRAEPSSHEEA